MIVSSETNPDAFSHSLGGERKLDATSEQLRYPMIFVGAVEEGLRQREAERASGL
jgi:hypothetical protein